MPKFVFTNKETGKKITINGPEGATEADARAVLEEKLAHLDKKEHDHSWFNVALSAAQNVPGSAMQYAKDMAHPFLHTSETVGAFKNLTKGIMQKYGIVSGDDAVKYADAAGKYLSDRYGGMDQIKETLMQDPVGLAADLSMVLGGIGVAGRLPGVAGKMGKVVEKAGRVVNPPQMLGKAAELSLRPGAAAGGAIGGMVGKQLGGQLGQAVGKVGQQAGQLAGHGMASFFLLPLARAVQNLPVRPTRLTSESGKLARVEGEAGGPEGGQVVASKTTPVSKPTDDIPQKKVKTERITTRPQVTVTPREGYAGPQE